MPLWGESAKFLGVCLGGAVGSGARYWVGLVLTNAFGLSFPFGTLAVNWAGSFLLGALVVAASASVVTETWRVSLASGLLGGFTTYSALNQETLMFFESGAFGRGTVYLGATLVGGLVCGYTGAWVARLACSA